MTIHHAVAAGLAENSLSKKITGSDEVCTGRTAVETGSGAVLGGTAGGPVDVLVCLGGPVGPVTITLVVGSALVGWASSLFD